MFKLFLVFGTLSHSQVTFLKYGNIFIFRQGMRLNSGKIYMTLELGKLAINSYTLKVFGPIIFSPQ